MGIAATDPGDSSDEKGNLPTKITTSSASQRLGGENPSKWVFNTESSQDYWINHWNLFFDFSESDTDGVEFLLLPTPG